MLNKKTTWISVGLIIVLSIILYNVFSRQKEPMRIRPSEEQVKPIKIETVQNRDIAIEIMMSGPLYAYNKVELYAEVSGVLLETPKRFKEGFRYDEGDVLLKIDDRVYKNNVLAQKSSLLNQLTLLLPDLSIDYPESARRWENYLKAFDVEKPLAPLPAPDSDQEKYFIASRNIYSQYYSIKSMEETLVKYSLKAPFHGVVTEANINPGTLVRMGQKLGEFTSTDLLEMEATVGIQGKDRLRVGQKAVLTSEMLSGTFEGSIQRINSVIDRSSMTFKVYIHTRDSHLTDGMYLTARVAAEPIRNAYEISRDLINGSNMIYAVEDSILSLKQVTVISQEGDRIIVRGLADGTQILGDVWTEAREGKKLPPQKKMGRPGRSGMPRPSKSESSNAETPQSKRDHEE